MLQGFQVLPRTFRRTDLKGVRMMPVTGFEHSRIFYTAVRKTVKVLRVLHAARDYPSIFA
jgi:plasmid stabilization system protein ParE